MILTFNPNDLAVHHGKRILLTAKLAQFQIQLQPFLNPSQLQNSIDKKLPILTTQSFTLNKTNAIIRFLAKQKDILQGSTLYQQALVDQWCDYIICQIEPAIIGLHLSKGIDKDVDQRIRQQLMDKLVDCVNEKIGKYVVGNSLSLADIVLFSVLQSAFMNYFDQTFRKTIPNITKWFIEISNLSEVLEVYGSSSLCQKTNVRWFKEKKKQKKAKEQGDKKGKDKQEKKKNMEQK